MLQDRMPGVYEPRSFERQFSLLTFRRALRYNGIVLDHELAVHGSARMAVELEKRIRLSSLYEMIGMIPAVVNEAA